MENGVGKSHGSILSASKLTHTCGARGYGYSIKPTKFVNRGLLLWNHSRKKWIENKKPASLAKQPCEPKISWNDTTYDRLLSSKKPYCKPIPLSEMVEFLVDSWEQQGMYD